VLTLVRVIAAWDSNGVGKGGTTSAGHVQILANESMVDVVEVAMDEETIDVGKSPIKWPGQNALQIMPPPPWPYMDLSAQQGLVVCGEGRRLMFS